MKIDELFKILSKSGIKILLNDNKLKVDAPKGALTQDLLEKIKNHKEQILNYLKKHNESTIIPLAGETSTYPLTHAQKGLWVIEQMQKSSTVYNMPSCFILKGEFKEEVLQEAYIALFERHETLKTVISMDNGELVQKINEDISNKITIIDIREEKDKEKVAKNLVESDFIKPFHLETEHLVRVSIIRLTNTKCLVVLNMHHIVSDGWSMDILFRDFIIYYNSFRLGKTPELPQLRIQYKDFCIWQNEFVNSISIKSQKEYWLKKLSGEIPVLNLPSDKKRPGIQRYEGKSINFYISKEITKKLNEMCQMHNVSLFMMLQGLLKVLLYKYTGQNDIIIGSPIAGRDDSDLENLIGMFVNTLVYRDTIIPDQSFSQFLQEVKTTCIDAINNKEYPFIKVIEDLKIERDLSRSPLFDVVLTLQNGRVSTIEVEGLESSIFEIENKVSKFDLNFEFRESDNELYCNIEYNTDIYYEERIARMREHLKELISSVIQAPELKIKDLNILTKEEKKLLLTEFNHNKTEYVIEKTIVEIFEEQVEKTPDNIAIVFNDIKLTYRELNEKANRVAHYLRDNYKIKQDDLVGVMLEKSENTIISLLGVLKSGAAYVPLDKDYPKERIDYMLDDTSPKAVISDFSDSIYINIDQILKYNKLNNPHNICNPESLAYVIYTSGSTGKPKGVLIENRSVIRLIKNTNYISIKDSDKIFQTGAISFDASTFEIWGALLNGAQLYTYSNLLDLTRTSEYILKNKISILWLTAGLFNQIVRENIDFFSTLKVLIVGGDILPIEAVNTVIKLYPDLKVINGYGPTENTTFTCCYSIEDYHNKAIPIGSPISNTKVYICDKDYKLLPVGVPGELLISGDGLARGYLNKPELTEEKFITHPVINERMYKTGDLVRWCSNGNIEFLGRIDKQVKIRGYRIELGEIENCLLSNEEVTSAIVIDRVRDKGDKVLVAYYLAENNLESNNLRTYLEKKLPEYMIPSFFVKLETIPLTSNGKIDREALPDIEGNYSLGTEYIPPETKTEKKLISICEEVLGLEKISINSNFFNLGGHSLKAVSLVSSIQCVLEIDITLKNIFTNPILKDLALFIDNASVKEYKSIERVSVQDTYELSHSQRRLWALSQIDEESSAYNIPVAFYLSGDLKSDALINAYNAMIIRHESLRTVFVEAEGEPRQKIQEEPSNSLEFLELKEKEIPEFIMHEFNRAFELENGPLIRFNVVKLKNKSLVLFNMHHIIFDGWSANIFINEFIYLYNNFSQNKEVGLEPLRIQYKDYSFWQNQLLNSSDMEKKKEYWLNKLSGELPVLNLPSENIRPSIQTFNGSSYSFTLSKEVEGINKLCLEQHSSLFMFLQALIKILIYRYTGQEDIILGSPVAGRTHKDLESQIGFYVNTLALRDEVQGDMDFIEFWDRVSETCTNAFENQDYPFDKLVDELKLKRDISRSPLFDIMLILQNNDSAEINFKGLTLAPYEMEHNISKYDLTFEFSESKEELICNVEYNIDIFSKEEIQRMTEHLKTLVSSVLVKPESKIKDLNIIPAEEKKLLLADFNQTQTQFPCEKTVIDIFEEQVIKTPENIAIIFEDKKLTYKKLNEKANIVANYLRENYYIKPGDQVGILVDRSEKMIITLLGVLKSGAAYVPIDTEFPVERITYMQKDSDLKVIITSDNSGSIKENYIEENKLYIDIDEILSSNLKKDNPEKINTSDNLAYIIYTSGSTGKPKGTAISHKNITNFIKGITDKISFTVEKRILSVTTISFDIFVLESFLPLSLGQTIVLANKSEQLDPYALQDVIERSNVDIIQTTPSRIKMLTSTESFLKTLGNLTDILVGGEAFPEDLLKILNKNCNGNIYNMYGPTETTVWSSLACLTNEKSVHIGKPIANTQMYILDKNLNLLPVGIPGELYIAGEGLSSGYYEREELTKEKFIDNPFKIGSKMYRTGDAAYWLPDGNIKFTGRIDNQVKVRGYRVEPEEIENILIQHEDIQSAVVLVRASADGDQDLIAYYVHTKEVKHSELRFYLKSVLPEYMIPSFFIPIENIPFTPNGKVDRNALQDINKTVNEYNEYTPPANELEKQISEILQEVLQVNRVGIHDNFFDLGGNSFKLIKFSAQLKKELNLSIPVLKLYTYTTVQRLVDFLHKEKNEIEIGRKEKNEIKTNNCHKIAIIGMSGRFPGAFDTREYWQNLKEGKDSITHYSKQELLDIGYNKDLLEQPNYIRANGTLEGKEFFDAGFFGYTPSDAEIMNPQTRIFHEQVWAAMEDAGYVPDEFNGTIGLFAGGSTNANWFAGCSINNPDIDHMEINQLSDSSFMSSRVSYKLNLKGPSYFTNTACSTSMVNIVIACENLVNDNCKIALAGGITLGAETKSGYLYNKGSILSSDGQCKAFSDNASGTVGGEGVGVIVLKRLEDAIKDNDNIQAVIIGYGTNNDGNNKAGYTAPSIQGQAELIQGIHNRYGIDSDSISYIEAHGTGTVMGDPIEVEALKLAFNSNKEQYCGIGSVKSNIGHLDSAAGVAGVIKTVLSLKGKQIPPTLYVNKPNPLLDLDESPFYINNELKEWDAGDNQLRAGVSSFGIGGTNAHIVLEEAAMQGASDVGKVSEIINISGKTQTALVGNKKRLLSFLKDNQDVNLSDLSYTLNLGRKHFNYRFSVVTDSVENLIFQIEESLEQQTSKNSFSSIDSGKLVFMYPGQGSQYRNMGYELYSEDKRFRIEVDSCIEILRDHRGVDFKEKLFNTEDEHQSSCALFIIEYCLTKLLEARGLKPDIMIGHSLGEFCAACISGVMSLKDALILVYDREQLINKLPAGSMLSVFIEKDELMPLLNENLSLAVENSDSLYVVSGDTISIENFKQTIENKGYEGRYVNTNYAFHSHMLDPILEEFRHTLSEVNFNRPEIPYVSNVTGKFINSEEVMNPEYWLKHFRNTVLFSSGINELLQDKTLTYLEVGPGRVLTSIIKSIKPIVGKNKAFTTIHNSREKGNYFTFIQDVLSDLWCSGVKIGWEEYYHNETRRKISLPTYAFDRVPFRKNFNALLGRTATDLIDSHNFDNNEYLTYTSNWKGCNLKRNNNETKIDYLIFSDKFGVAELLLKELTLSGHNAICVHKSSDYSIVDSQNYHINPNSENDYIKLFQALKSKGIIINKIIYAWGISNPSEAVIDSSLTKIEEVVNNYVMNITDCISSIYDEKSVDMYFLVNNLYDVLGSETMIPSMAFYASSSKFISEKFSNIQSCLIDLCYEDIIELSHRFSRQLSKEITSDITDRDVALRNKNRWVLEAELTDLEEYQSDFSLKENGVYCIIGSLSDSAFAVCSYLAKEYKAKIVLITDEESQDYNENRFKVKSNDFIELRKHGAEISIVELDMKQSRDVVEVITNYEQSQGLIDGILYIPEIYESGLKSIVESYYIFNDLFKNREFDFLLQFLVTEGAKKDPNVYIENTANSFLLSLASHYRSIDQNVINVSLSSNASKVVNSKVIIEILEKAVMSDTTNILATINGNGLEDNDTQGTDQLESNFYSRPELNNSYIPPGNELEKNIANIWADVLGFEKVGISDNFFELGGNSVNMLRILSRINALGYNLSVEDIAKYGEVATLAKICKDKTEQVEIDDDTEIIFNKKYKDVKNLLDTDDSIEDIYPLTPMQSSVLGYNIFHSKNGGNTQSVGLTYTNMQMDRLISALNKVFAKHDILRSTFRWRGVEEPYIIISKKPDLQINKYDYSKLSEEETEEKIAELAHAESNLGFNVEKKLFRFTLVKKSDRSVYILFSYLNSVMDGWSLNAFFEEVNNAYSEEETEFTEIKRSLNYRRYICWLQDKDIDLAQKFWINELSGFSSYYENKLVASSGNQFLKECKGTISELLLDRMNEIIKENRITFNSLITGLWAHVLSEVSGFKDQIVGMVSSVRPSEVPGSESLIGLFTNIIPMRITVPNNDINVSFFIDIHNKINEIRKYDYIDIMEIAKWTDIPLSFMQDVVNCRTINNVNSIGSDSTESEFDSGELLTGMRLFVSGNNLTIKYMENSFSKLDIESIIDNLLVSMTSICNIQEEVKNER